MSRIGKQPIEIPPEVTVTQRDDVIAVKGPKGETSRSFREGEVKIFLREGKVELDLVRPTLLGRALWGTYASHIRNMVEGVQKGFEKKLIIEGVGFRAESSGRTLTLSIGFSHSVKVPIPEGIVVTITKNIMTITGVDKELVGEFSAYVRSLKKPEPYKGKGIRYDKEVLRRKQGKKAA